MMELKVQSGTLIDFNLSIDISGFQETQGHSLIK